MRFQNVDNDMECALLLIQHQNCEKRKKFCLQIIKNKKKSQIKTKLKFLTVSHCKYK
jgi:hypothetical protein